MERSNQNLRFEVLFDRAESSPFVDEAFVRYGNFGFPPTPGDRPWIYANFVQSLDGITSLLGKHASGAEISQSRADRWLMDLLRAHADGLIMGMNTLREEQRNRGPESRGIVFQVAEPSMLKLREKLGKARQRNIFVTRAVDLNFSRWKAFDGDAVDVAIVRRKYIRTSRSLQRGLASHSIFRRRFGHCDSNSASGTCSAKAAQRFMATWREPILSMRSLSPFPRSRPVRLFLQSRNACPTN